MKIGGGRWRKGRVTTAIGSGEWWERRKVEDVKEGGKKWEKVQGRSKEAC